MTTQTNNTEKINNLLYNLNSLREELNTFTDLNIFEIKQQGVYFFVGVKYGYTSFLKKEYSYKTIMKYLNILEEGVNNGLVCSECLKVGIYSRDKETNAFLSKCKEHGSLI